MATAAIRMPAARLAEIVSTHIAIPRRCRSLLPGNMASVVRSRSGGCDVRHTTRLCDARAHRRTRLNSARACDAVKMALVRNREIGPDSLVSSAFPAGGPPESHEQGIKPCDWATSRCRCIRCTGTGAETLKEDREAIILADQLGFYDAFMGEHLTDRCENVTNSMLFLATLIRDTKQIKLATGTTNLSQMHPVLIAAARRDVRPPGGGPLHLRRQPRRADLGRRGARHPRRGPQQDVRRGDRRDPGDLGARAALRHRLARTTASRCRPRAPQALPIGVGYLRQAVPEAAARDRRHRGGAVLARRRADGQARLPSAVGELPAVETAEVALAELRQGQGGGGRRGQGRRLARGAHDLRGRRRQGRASATAATTPTAPTSSTGARCWRR